jgi:MFS-type transporter involved in bile tolerance (Atg22 family)
VTLAMGLYVCAGYRPLVVLLIFGTILNASGRSLQHPGLSALISQNSDPKQQGTVFGLYHMLGSLARFIGPMIATGVYMLHHTGPFALAACMTLGIAMWTVVLRRQNEPNRIVPVPG